jgi:hypothetical protein
MKNVTELRDDLIEVYKETKSGKTDKHTAVVLANIAGKIIKSAAVQLNYAEFIGDHKKRIKFLDSE